MNRRSAVLLAVSTIVLGRKAYSATDWVEGQHYFRVPRPQPVTQRMPPGKPEVTEVFSYGCPACDSFEPVMQKIRASVANKAQLSYLPASFNAAEAWPMFQRAFYTAQAMGLVDRTHQAMYDAVWQTGELAVVDRNTHRLKNPPPSIEDAAKFYERTAGVKRDQFLIAAKSFGVDTNMQRADDLIIGFQVDRTPTIIVNGKYRAHAQSAGGYQQLIELVNYLVAKESKPAR
jgi:protein dithiol oxidoreductase (disulfide-forming)